MSELPYEVGYGRPPRHTQFQKGQSGNPGGKAGMNKRLSRAFGAALNSALVAKHADLEKSEPTKALDRFVRKLVLDAAEGRNSAQRLVVAILTRESCSNAPAEDDDDLSGGSIIDDENLRLLLGDRFEDFRRRYETARAKGSREEIEALAAELEAIGKFPASGNF